ncbi:MAG: hypothetical protein HPY62_07615 [Bacteroidales bacterium]|nr:hypothetical protein [Bacteroidales bacterium]
MPYSRKDFVSKLIRAGLAMILLFLAYLLGSKAVAGKECSDCPGYGICRGNDDCSTFKK